MKSYFNTAKEKQSENQTVFNSSQYAGSRFLIVSSLGLTENIAAILTYIVGFISGFIMLLVERKNRFVRFHALQSIYLSFIFITIYFLLEMVLLFSWISGIFLFLAGLVLWGGAMLNAYKGRYSRIPYISEFIKERL